MKKYAIKLSTINMPNAVTSADIIQYNTYPRNIKYEKVLHQVIDH